MRKTGNKTNELQAAQPQQDFSPILEIIRAGQTKALQTVTSALIETYWAIGGFLSAKTSGEG